MQLKRKCSLALDIGPGGMNLRPGHFSGVNVVFDFEIGVRLERARGTDCGYSCGKIEARKAVRHLAIDPIAHGIKHVVMHADQAGDDGVAVEV